MDIFCLFITLIGIPMAHSGPPGTFFWKPRLGLDLSIPTTEPYVRAYAPTREHISKGKVVLIDGYQAGITIIAVALGISSAKPFLHLNPMSAYYYTNAYRWLMRHISMLQFWFGGNGETYASTHKVWRRRFYYTDTLVPKWLRKFLPFIHEKEWKKEEEELRRFKIYAEPAFGKYFRYPSTRATNVDNYNSQAVQETIENLDDSKLSIKPWSRYFNSKGKG